MPETSSNGDEPCVFLDDSPGLAQWSFADQAHYKSVTIPADEHSVLVNNGLSLKLFDRFSASWVEGSLFDPSTTRLCTPPIPTSSSYAPLHYAVSGTNHTLNKVISNQADCLKELSLHQYMAFSSLCGGPRLQWLNILRELALCSLSFRCEEVHTLITQAAWQIGPLSDGVHEWHEELSHPVFGRTILCVLNSHLNNIEANWL
ncbi:hypothetical protein B0F90DRAFT_1782978 [Multifurca ochricompacta]|uniref:Uncharacterized protein n=1 Tax=Multifurca ochricompacta TaxID=376703 RepID=A0AAD4QJ10_9AGAM|nr:hypothetical protein B0F90DRAFT_1782978 [Multifurca ochricompacta]